MRHLERFFQHCLHMRDCIQSTNGLLLLVSDYKICITGAHYRIQAHIKVDFFASFSHIFSCFKKSIFRPKNEDWWCTFKQAWEWHHLIVLSIFAKKWKIRRGRERSEAKIDQETLCIIISKKKKEENIIHSQ